jgi:hypothetical protein
MARNILFIIAGVSILTGFYIFFAPQRFYDSTPGLEMMGPFSIHFIRDVALAFLVSGGAMGWGAWKFNNAVAITGAAWPTLHAVFHIQIWGVRGFPFDSIFAFDVFAVIIPAFVALYAAVKLAPKSLVFYS